MEIIPEFKIEPIRQLIIQDLVHEDIENYLYHCYVTSSISKIWVDGMIVDPRNFTYGDQEYKDMANGLKYYAKLVFVKLPKYTKSVKWNGGNYELVLLNYNNNPRFKKLAKWIKVQPAWKATPERIS